MYSTGQSPSPALPYRASTLLTYDVYKKRWGKFTLPHSLYRSYAESHLSPSSVFTCHLSKACFGLINSTGTVTTVSYTHLDVYKRQVLTQLSEVWFCILSEFIMNKNSEKCVCIKFCQNNEKPTRCYYWLLEVKQCHVLMFLSRLKHLKNKEWMFKVMNVNSVLNKCQ